MWNDLEELSGGSCGFSSSSTPRISGSGTLFRGRGKSTPIAFVSPQGFHNSNITLVSRCSIGFSLLVSISSSLARLLEKRSIFGRWTYVAKIIT
ncbi:hypothetical protein VNO77_43372 [Canavalia gladiata]|uniref:Uncharacterized protein n=1 Tax=Canavalia gladiata TaxID=3824 RepID=A0AAN9PPC0_CANGL